MHLQHPAAVVGLLQGTGLLWLGLAGAFGYTPPGDASGDGLWVAEQAEGGAISWPWAVFWGVRWAVAQIQGGAQ